MNKEDPTVSGTLIIHIDGKPDSIRGEKEE
jgi:hypothetical protein